MKKRERSSGNESDMAAMIFDTHAHYDDARFDEDRETLLMGMRDHNVGRIMTISASVTEWENVIALTKKYDFIYGTLGVHPDYTGDLAEEDMERMESLLCEEKIKGIGEIGFDFYGESVSEELQRKWFVRQLELAEKHHLPTVIHSRDAVQMTFDLLTSRPRRENPGIIHCFSSSPEMAEAYVKMGYKIGIGGVVTFKNGRVLKEVVSKLPLKDLVLETDAPYLAPMPHRGERNDSTMISYVVKTIAALKNVSEEEILETTWKNGCDVFQIQL